MNYAVELYFDEESSVKIEHMRCILKNNGVTVDEGTRPHITLAIFNDIQENILVEKVRDFSKTKLDMQLIMSSVGIFPTAENVVFLAPKVTEQLLVFHDKFLEFMEDYNVNLNRFYDTDLWVPHCTLGIRMNDDELVKAVRLLKINNELPILVSVMEIGILKFPPNEEIFNTSFINE